MWHIQRTVPNWLDSVRLLPDGAMVKATESYQIFREVKAINPRIFTVHRMVRDEWQHYTGSPSSGWFDWETAKSLARTWFNAFVDGTFRDQIEPYCDAASWHNEIWANSQNQTEWDERIAATEAAIYVWNTEYRPTFSHEIPLIIGEAAVGNWMPRRIAELSLDGCLLGYHPYDYWRNKQRGDAGMVAGLSMLWDTMEHDWGLKPTWIFTEAGPFESAVDGWRSSNCLGGDRALYVDAVRQWMVDVAKTPAYKEGRIKGFSLFTTFDKSADDWGTFHTEQPELNMLAEAIAADWQPGTAPPPEPPPPEPPPGVPYKVVVNLLPQDASMEEKLIVLEQVHEQRETILQSADDAARLVAPGKPGSLVRVWDAERWPPGIAEWLQERGVEIVEFSRFETVDP